MDQLQIRSPFSNPFEYPAPDPECPCRARSYPEKSNTVACSSIFQTLPERWARDPRIWSKKLEVDSGDRAIGEHRGLVALQYPFINQKLPFSPSPTTNAHVARRAVRAVGRL